MSSALYSLTNWVMYAQGVQSWIDIPTKWQGVAGIVAFVLACGLLVFDFYARARDAEKKLDELGGGAKTRLRDLEHEGLIVSNRFQEVGSFRQGAVSLQQWDAMYSEWIGRVENVLSEPCWGDSLSRFRSIPPYKGECLPDWKDYYARIEPMSRQIKFLTDLLSPPPSA